MRDVGDTIRLVYAPRDAAGDPVDPDTVQVTVTLPDGSTAAPTVDHPSAGQYTADYVIEQRGRHVVHWSATGPDDAYLDVFNAASPEWPALVGLAEVKRHLNYDPDDTSDDEELRGFILSASEVVEDIVGVMARRQVTETNSGGTPTVRLATTPVLSVVSVIADGELVDPEDYRVTPGGVLLHRTCWPAGVHNIETVYLAGRQAIPASVIDGTKELIRVNWRPQQGGNYSSFDLGQADDFGVSRSTEGSLQGELRLGFFVPNTVVQRLQPHRRAPVVL